MPSLETARIETPVLGVNNWTARVSQVFRPWVWWCQNVEPDGLPSKAWIGAPPLHWANMSVPCRTWIGPPDTVSILNRFEPPRLNGTDDQMSKAFAGGGTEFTAGTDAVA